MDKKMSTRSPVTEADCLASSTPSYSGYSTSESCPLVWEGEVCWPQTSAGDTAFVPCANGFTTTTRYCHFDGEWGYLSSTDCDDDMSSLYPNNFTYSYEYDTDLSSHYLTLEKVSTLLKIVSVIVVLAALVTWVVVWVKRRHISPYRYASFVVIFAAALLFQTMQMSFNIYHHSIGSYYNDIASCLFFEIFPSVLQLLITCCLLAYLLFCVVVALRHSVPCKNILIGILCAVGFSLLWSVIYIIVLFATSGNDCIYAVYRTHLHFVIAVPKILVLVLLIVLDIVIIVSSFFLDNERYKESRDYRLIRYSSLTVLLSTLYIAAQEVMLLLFRTVPHHLNEPRSLAFITAYRVLYDSTYIVLALLLCFLDLEVLSMCPCACVKLDSGYGGSLEFQPLAKPEAPAPEAEDKSSHVSTFELDLTPRIGLQVKNQYGAIPERP
ncbi:vasoactive intestinal polypeptide receptor [Aplysia californica]|uniref:Vasoactive intestinal polypeptide receptor n=1 Tax=Aplysia californica TaxID=6500 RepID=A0ABM0K6X4_APLCA|nr:vasoactive intestinal polypeptide receptor [Aplysia californica]